MRYLQCDAVRKADGTRKIVADRSEIDSRASMSLPCAAVRVPDVSLDITALGAPRPFTTRLCLLHWGPDVVHSHPVLPQLK